MTTKRVDGCAEVCLLPTKESLLWTQFSDSMNKIDEIRAKSVEQLTVPQMCVELLTTSSKGLELKASSKEVLDFKSFAWLIAETKECKMGPINEETLKEVARCEEVKRKLFEALNTK